MGGGNALGTIDCLSNTNLNYAFMIGKMEAKAILQPTGIGALLPFYNTNISARSWTMQRQVTSIAWENGSLIRTTTLADDNSNEIFTYVKAKNGDIFDLDTPGCPPNEIGTNVNHTAEIHENFFEYVSVNIGNGLQICSETNTYSYFGLVDVDNPTNKVQTNVLSLALIPQQILTNGPAFSAR